MAREVDAGVPLVILVVGCLGQRRTPCDARNSTHTHTLTSTHAHRFASQRVSVSSGLVDEWHTIRDNERPGAEERQAASELPRTKAGNRDSNSAATAAAAAASVSDAPEAQTGDAVASPNDALTVDGQAKAPHVDGRDAAKAPHFDGRDGAKAPHFDGRDGAKAPHFDGRRQFTVGPTNDIDFAIAVARQVIGCHLTQDTRVQHSVG